jgi:predicted DNA-binding transcriptional regulator YafY
VCQPEYVAPVTAFVHDLPLRLVRWRGRAYGPAVSAEAAPRRDRQAVRMLGILKALSEGGRVTVPGLAARFRTTRQSIYRDLHALEGVGIPVVGDDRGGYGGQLRLAPGFRPGLPLAPLTRPELLALAWAAKERGSQQPFKDSLATARLKLQAILDRREADELTALDGTVSGDDRGGKDLTAHQGTLLRLVQAIVGRRQCVVEYQALGRDRPRRFPYDPYHIRAVQGGVYAVGRVPAYPKDIAPLALERIRSIEVLEQTFTVSPDFDPKRYEAEAFGVAWEKPMTVVVRFRADQAPYVREREWHPTQRLRTLADGRLEMTFRAGGAFEILRWVLGWGDAAELVRPESFRREIASILRSAAGTYREGGR